jgi:subfamily B ATP-binding cassette protein MsbA
MSKTPPRKDARPVPDVKISYTRLLSYLKPHLGRLVLALLALLIGSGLGLVFPLVIKELLDTVLNLQAISQLNRLAGLLLLVSALQAIFGFIEGTLLSTIGERIVVAIRKDLFHSLLHLPLQFHTERRVGELVSRISSDATTVRGVLTNTLTTLLGQGVSMAGSLAVMFYLDWRLMGFVLLQAFVVVVAGIVFGRRVRKYSTSVQDAAAESIVVAEETLSAVRVVKSFVREEHEENRFGAAQNKSLGLAFLMIRASQLFGMLMSFIGFGTMAGFLWFGGQEVFAGRISGGELAAFIFYGARIATSLASLARLYGGIQEALGASKRIFEIMGTKQQVADQTSAIVLSKIKGEITLEGVNFSYDPRATVLHEINLTIKAGEALALVGPSGAGKTTLFHLLPRFYDPTEGRVLVDGQDIKLVTQASLREQIAMVPQDTQLFGGSIRENILYGRLDATEEELMTAAKDANAHDFIMALPDGYDAIVGERGVKLSGGQKQRVAIARAILKNPSILLLDEATSSLDNESEGLVQEALHRVMKGRTTVIIAHRLSTIKAVNRIAVLEQGKMVGLGTHEDLMAQGGLYAKLYQMQFRGEEKE